MTRKRILTIIFSIIFIVIIFSIFKVYSILYAPYCQKTEYVYIPSDSRFTDVIKIFDEAQIISNLKEFEYIARLKNYSKHVHPGKYRIKKDMSLNALINMLRSGRQEPVILTIDNMRIFKQLTLKLSANIEADTAELYKMLYSEEILSKYNLTKDNAFSLFLPNTYEFFWNTSARQFITRMSKEYETFWNENRKQLARNMNMTQAEISILASIVQMESTKLDEMPIIAGVYINRLNKGIQLQADPTVVFAIGDFNIHRLLYNQLQINSPYNTYKYKGLPPGPICLPNAVTIDKVLNYQKHDYMFFCAKEDLSGYHYFARTVDEHYKNAQKYRSALNKLSIN